MILEIAFYLLLVALVLAAAASVHLKEYLAGIIALSVFSVLCTLLYAFMHAVDVAMAEAVIGAGFLTALFVTAYSKIRS